MRGYVYVLVNSSLPGLVKVGKTYRSPGDRAQELSGATGVPTPFVIAYDHAFEDCDFAEKFVHAELERAGLRQATNREFFRAPAADVVRIILRTPDAGKSPGPFIQDDETIIGREPWAGLLQQARDSMLGENGSLESPEDAFRFARQAASLGCAEGHFIMGSLYQQGKGLRKDDNQAIQCYKEAGRLGYILAFSEMATIFAEQGHRKNYELAASMFVDAWRSGQSPNSLLGLAFLDAGLWKIMEHECKVGGGFPEVDLITERAPHILASQREFIQTFAAQYPEYANSYEERVRGPLLWLQRVET